MSPRPTPGVLEIEPYKGGESALPGIAKAIKLSSNENALGMSPAAVKAFQEASASLNIYPEGRATVLRQAIAARYGLDAERIICGAGSDEIFHLLGRAYLAPGDEMVMTQYGFVVFRLVAQAAGAIVRVAPDRAYTVNVDAMLAQVTPKTKLVCISNPNNPTGTYVPFEGLRRLQAGLPPDVLLVIDSAYAEFVRRNDYSAGVELAGSCANVIMTRTFSKIHGLAALRVGWGYGPPEVIDALNRVRLPFNVSTAAQRAAVAALGDMAFAEHSAEHNARERVRVSDGLEALGFAITPGVANFVLVHFPTTPGRSAGDADAHLRRHGLIVRRVANYGLPDALRITIGRVEDNDAVLAAFAAFAQA